MYTGEREPGREWIDVSCGSAIRIQKLILRPSSAALFPLPRPRPRRRWAIANNVIRIQRVFASNKLAKWNLHFANAANCYICRILKFLNIDTLCFFKLMCNRWNFRRSIRRGDSKYLRISFSLKNARINIATH